MAAKYGCSIKTIQRRLDKVSFIPDTKTEWPVVVLMDTTYFGRSFGVMLFNDSYTGENLYKAYMKQETNKLYADGIKHLQQKGFDIKGNSLRWPQRAFEPLFGYSHSNVPIPSNRNYNRRTPHPKA